MPQPHAAPRSPRIDGWTPAAQLIFLTELGRSGVVARAAAAAGRSASTAYRFRKTPAGAVFDAGWRAATADLYRTLMQVALDRIAFGTPTDIVRGGEVVGQRRVYSDRTILGLLNHLRPAPPAAGEVAADACCDEPSVLLADPAPAFHAAVAAIEDAVANGDDDVPPVAPDAGADAAAAARAAARRAAKVAMLRDQLDADDARARALSVDPFDAVVTVLVAQVAPAGNAPEAPAGNAPEAPAGNAPEAPAGNAPEAPAGDAPGATGEETARGCDAA